MSTTDVTNPGSVNVADQSFDGLPTNATAADGQDQPANASANNIIGATAEVAGHGVATNLTAADGQDQPASASVNNVNGFIAAQRPVSVEQPVTVSSPATTALLTVDGDNESSVQRVSVDQPVTVSSPGPSLNNVNGDNESSVSSRVITTTQNTVAGQVYGIGTPANVFV